MYHLGRAEQRGVAADASLAAEMVFRAETERVPEDDIERVPIPPERPHERAQWDEATGRWIEWDDVDDEWDPVDTGHDPSDGGS
jgi:hypothetical protein